MIVVSDTSPINYLALINQLDLLPQLFGYVVIPEAVRDEMLDADAPATLRQWVANAPSWLEVCDVGTVDPSLNVLDAGERDAIALAEELSAALLLIDERLGRQLADTRGLEIVGTVGILDEAARRGLVDLEDALTRLQQTNFRISDDLIREVLREASTEE